MARLTLNMKEKQKKSNEANYLMDVVETYIDDCDSISSIDSFASPHVIIFALSTDDKSLALRKIEFVRRKVLTIQNLSENSCSITLVVQIDSQEWICPVILLAYRTPNIGPIPYDVMKQLKELSRNSRVFRCMESTGLGRSLLRHCFAVALMAARPFLATTRAENDVCIDDGLEKRREKPPRRATVEEKTPKIESLQNKSPFRKSCRIQ
ncbi:hypothetical protein COOONC_03054 [Cooperia oncophora]